MNITAFDKEKERAFLNSLVTDYTDTYPYSEVKKQIIVSNMLRLIREDHTSGLQFGCANGLETSLLAKSLQKLTVVDGSSVFIERLRNNNPQQNIEYVETLFEDYHFDKVQRQFDFIACNYVLEHVFDATEILSNIRTLMHSKSLLCITVPNYNALSRQLALEMGLLESLEGLTANDHKHGHRRTYSFKSLLEQIDSVGLEVVEKRGVVLKILADFQLNKLIGEKTLTAEHIEALDRLAQRPEHMELSDSIFLALQKKEN